MLSAAVARPNLSEDLCGRIRRFVTDGVLLPGARLNEVHLASELEVSRTPLREALSQLTAEGLIVSVPRRGFFTKQLSVAEVGELYPIRAFLDPQALKIGGIPDDRTIGKLRRLNERIANCRGGPSTIIDLDDDWHRLLLSTCDNQTLLGLIEQMIWKTRRYEYAYMSDTKNVKIATDEHERIIEALEFKDLSLACRLVKANMTSARAPLVQWLKRREQEQ